MKNRFKMLGSLLLGLMVFLSLAGQASAEGADGHETQIDGYTVTLAFPTGEVRPGLNDVNVKLMDAAGRLLGDAAVSIATEPHTTGMDMGEEGSSTMNMGGSPATGSSTTAGKDGHSAMAKMDPMAGSGQYTGQVDFAHGGEWMVVVAFTTVESFERSVSFPVDVPNHGPNWLVIGGFLGVIGMVILVALAKRKKPAVTPVPAERA